MRKLLFGLIALCVVLSTGCKRKSKYAYLADREFPVEIEVVGIGSNKVTNTYVGEIVAKTSIPLTFPLGGQITSVQVKSGQNVREGQVIATVDDVQAKSMLESAEAMLNQAQDGYRRLKPLHEQGGLSDVKWVEMETNLQKAQSMAISSRKRYEECTLRAVQKGVVNLLDIEVGQQLSPGQPIGEILDLSGRKATFTVPESEIGALLHGDKLVVALPALNQSFDATIDEKSFIATRLAHTYKVTAILQNCKDHANAIFLPTIRSRRENLYIGFFHTGAYQEALSGFGGIKHCLMPSPKHILIDRDKDGNLITSVFAEEQTSESMLRTLGYVL